MTTIYVTDKSPWLSASNLDDPTVATQILYAASILSTVAQLEHKTVFLTDTLNKDDPYVRWCRNEVHNRNWMLCYCWSLLAEYEDRFHCEHHFTKALSALVLQYDYKRAEPEAFLNRSKFHSYIKDPIEAYRAELIDIWSVRYRNRERRWKNCELPKWYLLEKPDAANSIP